MAYRFFTVIVYFVLLHYIELIFVDNGNPYANGPLPVGELTLTETEDKSPLHTKVYFPLPKNEFPVIFFVGGFDGVVLAEFYEIVLRKIASHGFYVFGVDYKFPVLSDAFQLPDLKPFYDELNFIHQYMPNKTLGTPLWNKMSLLCHSSGCDITLRMIRDNSTRYTSSVFLEPFSFDVQTPVTNTIPAMMYGTEYCEEGLATCCVKGKDYARFYDIWKCPRIKVEVASFGHCDILDPIPRQGCKTIHFCKISNETNVDNYRQFVQGAISSFLITELQGRQDAISYIADQTKATVEEHIFAVLSIYVDWGNPYDMGRLPVNDITITEIIDKSPLHTTAHYPNQSGEYPVVFFIGGMNGYVLSEMYTDVLRMVAAHGFVVFGVDYKYPASADGKNVFKHILKQDLEPYFNEIDFLKTFMVNRTPAKPVWNKLALMCHSSGCDCTLRMLQKNTTIFASTVFVEPLSFDAFDPVPNPVPAFMYGTQLAEEGLTKCCLPGTDFRQFYKIWKCPRLALEVADFGHCDILNREFWGVCTHICTKSNETRLDEYHKFIQGAISSFFTSTLQGRQDAILYLSDTTKIPVKLVEHQTDLNCTLEK